MFPTSSSVDAVTLYAHLLSRQNPKIAAIERAKSENLFPPSSLHCLNHLEKADAATLDILYLFAVSKNPDLSDADKQQQIEVVLSEQTKEQREEFFHKLIKDTSLVFTPFLLLYGSEEFWQESVEGTLCCSNASYQAHFLFWVKEIVGDARCTPLQKKKFMETLLALLPEEMRQDFCYYILSQATSQEIEEMKKYSSALIDIIKETRCFIEKVLATPITEKHSPLASTHFTPYGKIYLVQMFVREFLSHETSHRMVFFLDNIDWKQPSEPERALSWIIAVLKELPEGKEGDASFSCFFNRASYQVLGDIKEFLPYCTTDVLNRFFLSFSQKMQTQILKFLLQEPKRLIEWIRFEIANLDFPEPGNMIDFLMMQISWISKATLSSTFSMVAADPSLSQEELLLFYSAIARPRRIAILQSFPREKCVATLANWINLAERSCHRSRFAYAFYEDLYLSLMAIDFALAKEVKEACPPDLDLTAILPVECKDLEEPTIKRKIAMRRLSLLFLTPNMRANDRRDIALSLQKELQGSTPTHIWIPALLQELPQETWPMALFYFGEAIIRAAEERTWVSPEGWSSLLGEALLQSYQHPILKMSREYVARTLLQVAKETQVFLQIFHLCMEKIPSEFLPSLRKTLKENDSLFYVFKDRQELMAFTETLLQKEGHLLSDFLVVCPFRSDILYYVKTTKGEDFCLTLLTPMLQNLEDFATFSACYSMYQIAGFDICSLLQEPERRPEAERLFALLSTKDFPLSPLDIKLGKILQPLVFWKVLSEEFSLLLSSWSQRENNRPSLFLSSLNDEEQMTFFRKIKETPELLEAFTSTILQDFGGAFSVSSKEILTFLTQLFPNWWQELQAWFAKALQEARASALFYGEQEPQYQRFHHDIFHLYKNLQKSWGTPFLSMFRSDLERAYPHLKKDEEKFYQVFLNKWS